MTSLKLTAGVADKSKAKLKAKGFFLPTITLPTAGSLTVQLRNLSTDVCLTSTYLPEAVIQDATKGKLKARY